jgi:transposase
VVILDNLGSHKVAGVREAIEGVGGRLLYLPPYSPDLNPIENMWSKVKQLLRSAAARTFEALQRAVWAALDAVTPDDCRGFFAHCEHAAT